MANIDQLIEAVENGDAETVRTILDAQPSLVNERDETGGTALHCAAFAGTRSIVRLLVERGADINARDASSGATPAGWAIEYMRELGGFLGVELDDFAFAIRRGDAEWTGRLLKRFPALRDARDIQGLSFRQLAEQHANPDVARLFN